MTDGRIREYIIEGLLGRGGMGSVYRATHVHLKKKAALKILLEQFTQDISIKNRFVNEASLLHDLHHKNIVQQKEFFEENGRLVLVMEYVDGRPLDKMIGQDVGPIPWEKALPLFTQILDGIGYAHSKGIIHRDIKPANILISKEGTVKVTDLGIAKIAGEQGMTRTGAQMGTLYYESPEQIKGAKDVDHRSDIYSLGMTLYEMLAGRLPFDTKGDTSEYAIMDSIVKRASNLDPREHYPHIPEWLVKTIQKATDLNPDKRFQGCEHFKQIIEKYGKLSVTESIFWSGRVASVKNTPLAPSKPISTGFTTPPSTDDSKCPKCGSSVLPHKKFCDSCGEKLVKKCPECKADIRWSKNFCPDCGSDYKQKISNIEEIKQKKIEEDACKRKETEATENRRVKHARQSKHLNQRFLRTGNIITDSKNGHEWQVYADKDINWKEAKKWVRSLEGEWRMPFLPELRELYEAGVNSNNWGCFQNTGYWVWSSQVEGLSSAWFFNFFYGTEDYYNRSDDGTIRVFAVRSL